LARRRKPDGLLRILVIDDFVPDPLIGAGTPRVLQFLRALVRAGAEVTFFPTLPRPDGSKLKRFPISEIAWIKRRSGRLDRLAPFLRRRHQHFDAIIVSRRHNLKAFNEAISDDPRIAASKTIIFDSEALFATREALQRQILGSRFTSPWMTVEQEVGLARSVDTVIAVNEIDAGPFRESGHGDVMVLGYAVDPAFDERRHADRSGFLFVGPTYNDETPNSDSVTWFIDRVLPLIRCKLGPGARLRHVGKSTAPALHARAADIDARGDLDDLTEAFSRARVFVAPTRFASGIPLKVCEAAARGVPCVLTPLLARQLGWEHEREALLAETPEDFALQCLRLDEDPVLWQRIRSAAFERIARDCNRDDFDRIVAALCGRTRQADAGRKAVAAAVAAAAR
jgi:glycosyltransferase involved in cell wall biosynthesis